MPATGRDGVHFPQEMRHDDHALVDVQLDLMGFSFFKEDTKSGHIGGCIWEELQGKESKKLYKIVN